ncbi:MAG: hypothetical protein AAF495_00060 [Pseudomonadota bacterium]
MQSFSFRRAGLALAMGALLGAAGLTVSGPAKADDPAMVTENLLTAIYLEQTCSGHKFTQEEWDRLVHLVRELSPRAPGGEATLLDMQVSKVKAKDMAAFSQCSAPEIQKYRDIYARDLKPSL